MKMEKANEVSLTEPVSADSKPPKSTSDVSHKKRQGKQSKQNKIDRFRQKVSSLKQKETFEPIMRRLLGQDSTLVEQGVNSLSLTFQQFARPLSISTRGVGFAASAAYTRLVSAWSAQEVSDICTIHQFYRVHLYLTVYKLIRAQERQTEKESFRDFFIRMQLPFDVYQQLAEQTQVPTPLAAIVNSIGRVETRGAEIWHSGIPVAPPPEELQNWIAYCTTCIVPGNIRELVVNLSNDANAQLCQYFRQHCSLPGARWNNANVLQNPDDI